MFIISWLRLVSKSCINYQQINNCLIGSGKFHCEVDATCLAG